MFKVKYTKVSYKQQSIYHHKLIKDICFSHNIISKYKNKPTAKIFIIEISYSQQIATQSANLY